MLYHGVRSTAAGSLYRLGVALFDLEQPDRLLLRGDEWVFGPEAAYETAGDVANVSTAIDALQSADEEVKVAQEGLTLAENELAQARRRVDAGVAIALEVTDAQTRLARARDNQTAALFHHAQARIDLGQATGALRSFLQ